MKRKIAIVAGGDSSEHDVSLRSAQGLLSFMDKERYDVEIIELRGHDQKTLERLTEFDFVYITIHGTPGENGRLQGFLDIMGIPYSCCGVLASALTFNKFTCNHYLNSFGIRTAKSVLIRADKWISGRVEGKHPDEPAAKAWKTIASDNSTCVKQWDNSEELAQYIIEQVGLPCFIKSNVGGSSFGCTKVKKNEDALPAIKRAFEEGNEVICESFMKGTEITCGVYKTKEKAIAFPITEVVTHNEFFDYNAKYNGEVEEITPARIPDEVRNHVQDLTLRIYDIIGCQGIIRVDYILTDNNQNINLLEINTTPGMTATSFIPQQIRAAKLDIKDVLTDIIENKF